MWSSLFVQYDIPNVTMIENKVDLNKPQFVTYFVEDTIDCNEYVSVNNVYDRGLLYNSETGFIVDIPTNTSSLDIISSDSHSYVITKADGDYNHTAKQILERVINLMGSVKPDNKWKTDKEIFLKAWKAAGGNVSRLSNLLSVSRVTLYRYIKKYGLEK